MATSSNDQPQESAPAAEQAKVVAAIELAQLANDGAEHKARNCECEPETNNAPCRYCAIWDALRLALRYLRAPSPAQKKDTSPPEVIYLQYHGDGPPDDGPVNDKDVTWCRDRIFDSDLRYVAAQEKPVAASVEEMQQVLDQCQRVLQQALSYLVMPQDIEARMAKSAILDVIPVIEKQRRALAGAFGARKTVKPPTERPTHDDIAARAYQLYCSRAQRPGFETGDWLQAEHQLRGELARNGFYNEEFPRK